MLYYIYLSLHPKRSVPVMSAIAPRRVLERSRVQTLVILAAVVTGRSLAAETPVIIAAADKPLEQVTVLGRRPGEDSIQLDREAGVASTLGLDTRDTPLSVSIVGRDTMQERGQRTALDATNSAVGVSGGTLPGTIPRFSMRGFTDNNVTLLRDGIRQNTMAQSSRPVDAYMLERVEVLKGPASIMYGEGAVAGAINYVSREPVFEPRREAYVIAGQFEDRRGGFSSAGPIGGAADEFAYQLAIGLVDSGGYAARTATEQYSLSAGFAWRPSDSLLTTIQYDAADEEVDAWFGVPLLYDAVIDTRSGVQQVRRANSATDTLVNARIDRRVRRNNYNLADAFTEATNQYARWTLNYRFDEQWSLQNVLYLATHDVDWRNSENYVWNPATNLVERDLFYIYRDDRITGNRAALTWQGRAGPLGALRIVGGFDWSDNELVRGTRVPGALPASLVNVALLDPAAVNTPTTFVNFVPQADARIETASPFVELLIEPSARLKIIGGIRRDRIDVERIDRLTPSNSLSRDYRPTTGRLGMVWTVAPQWNVYGSWTTAAEPVQQFVSISTAQGALSLQRGRQWEVGLKATIFGGTVDLTAAAYQIEKSDLLTTTVIGGQSVSQTVGEQQSRGVELAGAWRASNSLVVEANAAFTDAEFSSFNEVVAGGNLSRDGNTPPNVPRWVANAFVRYDLLPRWTVTGALRYVGARYANNANLIELDSFLTLDASIDYSPGRWTVGLRGRNLTDELYADWAINQGLQQRLADPRSAEIFAQVRW
jgi:iron complex outermembrane recepter protein